MTNTKPFQFHIEIQKNIMKRQKKLQLMFALSTTNIISQFI